MSSGEQRETIIRAALPLIGPDDTLTTARIAEAAGMTEVDLLAVFGDKDAVMRACMNAVEADWAAAVDPAEVLRELEAIPSDRPLAARLVEVIEALDTHDRTVSSLPYLPASWPSSCTAP